MGLRWNEIMKMRRGMSRAGHVVEIASVGEPGEFRPARAAAAGLFGFAVLSLAFVSMASAAPVEELECLIEPRMNVALGTPIEGVIEEVLVERGDTVEKDQTVLEIESSLQRAAVDAAAVRLDLSQRDLNRLSALWKKSLIAQSEYEAARAARDLARIELKRAKTMLELRSITSPISGVVIKRLFDPGEYADNRPILELADINPLHVELFAPLAMLGAVRPGMTADILPEGPGGGRYKARVTVVDPVLDAASGTFGVRLELPNPGQKIQAGLRCRMRIDLGQAVGAGGNPAAAASAGTNPAGTDQPEGE